MKLWLAKIEELANRVLSMDRLIHTKGVVETAVELACRHGLNKDQARLAAWGHDLAKEVDLKSQLEWAEKWGLLLYPEDKDSPHILHGPLAAFWLEHCWEWKLNDKEVLAAIAHHTLGVPQMSPLEMVIYSADLVEPNRVFPEVDNLRQALYHSLEKGTLACVEHTLNYLERKKRSVHPLTRATYEDLRRRLNFGT